MTPIVPPFLLDVTLPPFGADPTGRGDSTAAIVRAIDFVVGRTRDGFRETLAAIEAMPGPNGILAPSCENRKVEGKVIGIFPSQLPYAPTLYFPPGTYRISDTIGYSFEDLQNSFGNELSWQIRWRGAGADRSILRLDDKAEGFAGEEPKPMVTFMRGRSSNVAMSNYFEDLALETGRGNSSALGLDFFANNSGAVRRVRVRSGDGTGFAGVSLGRANYSGVLLQDIETEGFDYGLHLDSPTRTMYGVAEDVRIRNPRRAGIFVGNICASLRKIEVSGGAPGLICDGESAHVVLLDSSLQGSGSAAIEHRKGVLYASEVKTAGYASPWCSEMGTTSTVVEASGQIRTLVLPKPVPEIPVNPRMLRLPVEEAPAMGATGPAADAIGVRAFGACGDGSTDDTVAIQRALNAGASEVYFEPGRYRLGDSLTVPTTVRRIRFNFVDLVAGESLASRKVGAFIIAGETSESLRIEDLFAWEEWRGEHYMFDHASRRTLVLSDLHTQTLPLYRNSVEGGRVFLENVACTAGVVPGQTGHGRTCLIFRNQRVWARQLNPERGEPMVLNDGGDLWALGFKTEDEGVAFETINGGRSEILGGILNSGAPHAVAFRSVDSSVRISAASNAWNDTRYFGTAIVDTQKGQATVVSLDDCVSRQYPAHRGPQFSIPFYASGEVPDAP